MRGGTSDWTISTLYGSMPWPLAQSDRPQHQVGGVNTGRAGLLHLTSRLDDWMMKDQAGVAHQIYIVLPGTRGTCRRVYRIHVAAATGLGLDWGISAHVSSAQPGDSPGWTAAMVTAISCTAKTCVHSASEVRTYLCTNYTASLAPVWHASVTSVPTFTCCPGPSRVYLSCVRFCARNIAGPGGAVSGTCSSWSPHKLATSFWPVWRGRGCLKPPYMFTCFFVRGH